MLSHPKVCTLIKPAESFSLSQFPGIRAQISLGAIYFAYHGAGGGSDSVKQEPGVKFRSDSKVHASSRTQLKTAAKLDVLVVVFSRGQIKDGASV